MDFIANGESGLSVRMKLNTLLGMVGSGGGGSLIEDIEQIKQQIIANAESLNDWMNQSDEEIDAIRAEIDEDKTEVQNRLAELRGDLTTQVGLLVGDVEAALNISRAYTDSSVMSEKIERQSMTDALTAQISELTSSLVSDDLISNGDFSAGWDYWEHSGATIISKDSSPNPPFSTMPADGAVSLVPGGYVRQTTETFELTADDRFQIRFSSSTTSAGAGARSVAVKFKWEDALGAQLGAIETINLVVQPGMIWRVLAARVDPPDTARFCEVEIAQTGTGSGVYLTKFQASIVNAEIEVRMAELEAANTTLEAAVALQRSETIARFQANEATMLLETANRANADGALSNRIDSLVASTGQNAADITALKTTSANADESIAALEEEVSARYGSAELVRDGSFARNFTWWPFGTGGSIILKSTTTGNMASTMPAPKALQILPGTAGWTVRRTARYPVTAEEALFLSAQYARTSTGVVPRLAVNFYDASGTEIINGRYRGNLSAGISGNKWRDFSTGLMAPVGATTVDVAVEINPADTGTTRALLTNISLRRRQAFDYLVSADIDTLKYAVSDPNGALAILEDRLDANWSNLDGRVTTNATAINQRYTKAEADQAVSSAVDAYEVTVANRLGQKANSSAVTTVNNRVTTVENVAKSKNTVYRQASPPAAAGLSYGDLWFDTSDDNKVYRWTGGNIWASVRDGDIPRLRSDMTATSSRIDQVKAQTDRGTAEGLIRMTVGSGPTGVRSRIGIRAEVSATGTSYTAAMALDARNDGTSEALFLANRFAIVTGFGTADRMIPFKVVGGVVYIDVAIIEDLSVGRLKLTDGAVVVPESSYTAGTINILPADGWTTVQTLTFAPARQIRQVFDVHFHVNQVDPDYTIRMTCNGTTFYQESVVGDNRRDQQFRRIPDLTQRTGNQTYRFQMLNTKAQSTMPISQRLIQTLNAYK